MSANASSIRSRAGLPAFFDALRWGIADALVMVKRNLKHIPRTPELLLDVTIQPVIFVLLFRYVFGGAIAVEGTSYVNYLMAGIFVQTLVFAAMTSGVGLSYDLSKGLVDRFRSLPMSRAAVVFGRTLTDLLRGLLASVVVMVVGFTVGFRPDGSLPQWLAALGVLLAFSFALSWVGVAVGLALRTPEAVQAAMFVAVFPLTFASSAFVQTQTMPDWLQGFAEHQPMSLTVDAVRGYLLGAPAVGDAWGALAWSAAIVVVFFPLAVWLYGRRTAG